jgi:ADP-ribose pyrophosphatase
LTEGRGSDDGDPPPFPPFEVVGSEQLYDSPWCGLRRDWIVLPSGARQEYHVFQVTDAVVVVPVASDGSLVMLWQHRHPHGHTHWEVPAGRIHAGEDPERAAERELLEETGHRAERIERLQGFYPVNGISDHYAHAYVAYGCRPVEPPKLEPAEKILVRVLPRERVRRMLLAGEIEDGFTALALYALFARERESG